MIQVQSLTGAGALGSGDDGGDAGRVVLLGLSEIGMGIAREEEERWERWDAGHCGTDVEVGIAATGVDDSGVGIDDEEGDGVVLERLVAAEGEEVSL